MLAWGDEGPLPDAESAEVPSAEEILEGLGIGYSRSREPLDWPDTSSQEEEPGVEPYEPDSAA